MNVSISTVEFDSQCVLTNHANSAACIMTREIHEYCLVLSAVPSFNSFEHVSFSVSCMNTHNITIMVRKSILTHLSCERNSVLCHNIVYDDRLSQPHHVILCCSQGYHDHFTVQQFFTDQAIAVLCPCCCYTLEDLGQCPILGRGQEVRVAVFCALHSHWTACLCQRGVPQFNAP